MKLRLVVELDKEMRRWSALFPELLGWASAAGTEAEAITNAAASALASAIEK